MILELITFLLWSDLISQPIYLDQFYIEVLPVYSKNFECEFELSIMIPRVDLNVRNFEIMYNPSFRISLYIIHIFLC